MYGPVLLLLAIVGLFFAESTWVRILCGVFLAVFAVFMVVGFIQEGPDKAFVIFAALMVFFALWIAALKKWSKKWKW